MKKYITIIYILFLFCDMQILMCNQLISEKTEQVSDQEIHDTNVVDLDKDDEKLLQEMLNILAVSYKNIIDIAALYFCGFPVDQNKLYEQIFIDVTKDVFNVIKLFAWYIPTMLKNSKLKTKEKLKKSFYVVSTTIVLWYICTEFLHNKTYSNSLATKRSLNLKSYDILTDKQEDLKPRNRPKIDS